MVSDRVGDHAGEQHLDDCQRRRAKLEIPGEGLQRGRGLRLEQLGALVRNGHGPCATVVARASSTHHEPTESIMATRFISKALAAAALGIALGLLFGGTTTSSAASSNTAGE